MNTLHKNFVAVALLAAAITFTWSAPAAADQKFNDDVIVCGSLCVGLDCVNGESFGFDTIRLKENNTRIRFFDTSSSASFPTNDWQLTANDSSNGGANKFSIDDIDGGRVPFTLTAGAPSNSLFVDSAGDVGLTTSTPVVELHIVSGDTPTLRLEQDGSSGFTPQTWDVAGNEANFFVRDVTNGSTLPFKIRPGAPSNALVIEPTTGDVGMGAGTNPTAALHVRRSDSAQVLVENTTATSGTRVVFRAENEGRPRIQLQNTAVAAAANEIWNFEVANSGNWVASLGGSGTDELQLAPNGDLTVTGDVFSATCSGSPCAPDYVFEPDYELKSLDEVASFIEENKHLPNVPSAVELTGPINISKMQMTLLEKIEELTLYTLEQHETIRVLEARLASLEEDRQE